MPDSLPWTCKDILDATGADLLSGKGENLFSAIATDSRKDLQGALFVALKGENHDGHDFLEKALAAGCAGILMEKTRWHEVRYLFRDKTASVFGVENTLKALGQLARHRLSLCGSKVLAVTGSNGKTSTKEMLGCIFRTAGPCLVTEGNFNNEIGLPLTLFRLKPHDKWAILELGMNHPGEMERLSAICQPDMAIITRIAPAHLEGLGSVEGVARAKGEILCHMKKGSRLLINGSDPNSERIPLKEGIETLRFGRHADCDYSMENLNCHAKGSSFTLHIKNASPLAIHLNVPGAMMAENAMAAAAAALIAGIPEDMVQEGLASFRGFSGRFQPLATETGFIIINDTYNANPDSMEAALTQTVRMADRGRSFAVLGSMGELGKDAAALHRHVGALAAQKGIHALYVCGPHGKDFAEGARSAGMKNIVCEDKDRLAAMIFPELKPSDRVLVKGSRSMTMESVVDQLLQAARTAQGK
ncbi:UDP-N-acetylmuramoyl-tripeptide--D-alanyl-D-alanine ligase [Desulfobotulus alkaliphilus]|uniref:UDP-N-acetylmuramoyl-tripeptide--D-alanyl-D-alanine ligase n=1 Tax=Desulfobotulus alkaliphilus TaxID=622671 RepID=A0A562RHY6_9BACT|nr:UDP-N-acetylmuramoyl-tripeptide--D-alanyl-D-alanine ligase [Desulfobotulus alkaliphilus]TWI68094.1 UDP-N-acetylmuramoyl-tripeptide--D-alanyl-D-alanine ligase [Desulfobotulus alkaliphilus]